MSIRKPMLIGKLLHESSGNAGILSVESTKYDDKVIEALDASVNLTIDGASSSASIKLAPGTNVNGRAYIEMFTIQGSAGVFRTRSPRIGYGNGNTQIQLEHAINQLGDFIITETYEKELTLENAVKKVFEFYDKKGSSYWTYGTIEKPDDPDGVDAYNQKCVLSIDHDNCLDALQSILEQYPYMYMRFNFDSFPWRVSFRNKPQLAEAEGRLSRNVKSATVTRDDSNLTTKAYGEYKNGKTYSYDAGKFYKNKYGLVEREIGGDYESDAAMVQRVKTWIKRNKKPRYSVSIDGIELSNITGEKLDKLTVGKLMTLALPDYNTTITEQITGVSFPSVYKTPNACTVTLNDEEDKVIHYIKKAQQSARRAGRSAARVQTAAIIDAAVANNILTLTKGDGTQVNFSKAVSLSTAWGSGTFTVKANQTNKNTATGKNETKTVTTATTTLTSIELQSGKAPSRNGTYNLDVPLRVMYYSANSSNKKAATGFTQTVRVSAKTVYDKGWIDGWDNAAGMVVDPGQGNSSSFQMKVPKKVTTTGGAVDRIQVTKNFTMSIDDEPSANGYARVRLLGVQVARISLTTYWTGGWDDAEGLVVMPGSGTGESFNVKVPQKTTTTGGVVDRSQVTKTFTLSIDTPSASGYARAKLSSTTVARISLTTYWTGGWDNAEGMVVMPSEVTSNTATFVVKVPQKTTTTGGVVDRSQASKSFTLSVDNNYAYVKLSNKNVARVSNSDVYNNGKKAATVTLTHGSVTTDSNYQKHLKYTAANASNTSNKVELEFYLVKNGTKSQLRTGSASGTLIMEINNS